MKKLLVFFLTLLIGANSLIAQVSTEEQTLLDNLKVAKNAKNVSDIDYKKACYKALAPLFNHYWSTGQYIKGIEIVKEMMPIVENLIGRYDQSYAGLEFYLACMYMQIGKYDEALAAFTSMRHTYQNSKIENPIAYANSICYFGSLHLMRGEYSEAQKYCFESLDIADKYSVNEVFKCTPYGALASIYSGTGQYKEAEKYMLKSLQLFPKEEAGYGNNLNNMGLLYFRMGRYDKAMDYYEQAHEVKKRFLPEKHPEHGTTISNIGLTNHYAGKYAEAEKYLLQAIEFQKELQENQPRPYANSLVNIGYLYADMGNYDKAIYYTKLGSNLLEQILGEEHLDYAASLFTLGKTYLSKGDYANAVLYGKKALTIQQKQDKKHPESVAVLIHIGKSYIMSKDYTNAQSLLNEAKDLAKQ